MFKKPTVRTLFFYVVWQDLYDQMNKDIPIIEFHQGLAFSDELYEWGAIEGHKTLVLDDLMIDAADKVEMTHLLCVGSHHYNIPVIHLLLNIFHKGKAMHLQIVIIHTVPLLLRSFTNSIVW